ncbi:MAG: hypothetical protein NTV52_27975, partial [Acidobacteria bacterium]|nr:hypothetical protein [Acidobacteriota bacterium]
ALRLPGQAPLTPYTIQELERVSPGLENEYLRARRTDGALATKTLPAGKGASASEGWKLDLPAEFKTVVVAEVVGMISTFYSPRNVGHASAKLNPDGQVVLSYRKEAVSVQRGEPNADLFRVPGSFAEVPPSVASIALLEKREGRRFGESADDAKLVPGLERMDKHYSKGLADRP